MTRTVLIRPLPQATPARAAVYHLAGREQIIDEGPSDPEEELKNYIRKTIKNELSKGNRNFILDLASVEWIDSTYIGMILAWYQLVEAGDGSFVLASLSDRSKDIMKVAKLDNILKSFDTTSAAQRHFAKTAS